jgi:RIO-like serine/threonine protein kinase
MAFFIGLTKIYDSKDDCKSEWEVRNIIGRGSEGVTYLACCKTDCTHVMKIEEVGDKDFEKEIKLSILFGEEKIGPKIISAYTGKGKGITIMEKLTITLHEIAKRWNSIHLGTKAFHILREKYLHLVGSLHNLGYLHEDLHSGNVMLKIDENNLSEKMNSGEYELRLIDFSRISNMDQYDPEQPDLEEEKKEELDFDRIFI